MCCVFTKWLLFVMWRSTHMKSSQSLIEDKWSFRGMLTGQDLRYEAWERKRWSYVNWDSACRKYPTPVSSYLYSVTYPGIRSLRSLAWTFKNLTNCHSGNVTTWRSQQISSKLLPKALCNLSLTYPLGKCSFSFQFEWAMLQILSHLRRLKRDVDIITHIT